MAVLLTFFDILRIGSRHRKNLRRGTPVEKHCVKPCARVFGIKFRHRFYFFRDRGFGNFSQWMLSTILDFTFCDKSIKALILESVTTGEGVSNKNNA